MRAKYAHRLSQLAKNPELVKIESSAQWFIEIMNYLASILILLAASANLFAKEKLIVLVNPTAGGGKAAEFYFKDVKPRLATHYELHECLEGAWLAIEQAGDELLSYKGIVGVGGDGTIHQIYKALRSSKFSHEAVQKLAIGHIPAGTGNALARSIFHETCGEASPYSAKALVEGIALGTSRPIDLWQYETDVDDRGISFLGLSHGVISDIDIGSESLRPWVGSLRVYLYSVVEWLLNRHYDAKLTLYRDQSREVYTQPIREIWAANIAFANERVMIAPESRFDDALLHVMYVSAADAGWLELARFLMSLALADVHQLPYVKILKAQALELETKGNYQITIDGELLPTSVKRLTIKKFPVQGRVFEADCSNL